jgi:transposase
MKDSLPPIKRRRYDAAFRAEALRLAAESRSTQAAARALNIDPKRIYKWQKEALTPVAAARGAELDPTTAAELRQLRAANRRQAQELEIFKKAIAGPARAATQGLHRAHHRFDPRAAVRPEPVAQLAQADAG